MSTATLTAPVSDVPVDSTDSLHAAPGCDTPEEATGTSREVFPALIAAGGQFNGLPTNPKGCHFDISLMPEMPVWPEMKDDAGAVIPYPWQGHSRLKHKALTKECFDSEQGYFYYRAYEAYNKALASKQDFTDARDGVERDAAKKTKANEKLLKDIASLQAELGTIPGVDINALIEAIKARNAATTAA